MADLPVQFGFGFLPVLVGPLSPVGEEIGQLLKKLRFPAADLIGVDSEHARQLGDGFLALLDAFRENNLRTRMYV